MASPITAAVDGSGVIEVDPISRIEGHLGVKVEVNSGFVEEADVHGNLWRGFENFLLGRESNDAITFTQRICGVCPVPHGLTATYAADTVLGYSEGHTSFPYDGEYGVPKKAVHIRNLVLGSESLMSSLTHQYHLVAPSYVQGPGIPPWTPYFDDTYYHLLLRAGTDTSTVPTGTHTALGELAAPRKSIDGVYPDDLWSAVIKSYVKALRIRRLTFEAGALFAGRMPMTSCYCAGGVTNYYTTTELEARCDKFSAIMQEIGEFIIKEYVPVFLALGALYPNYDNVTNASVLDGTVYGLPAVTPAKYSSVGNGTLWQIAGNSGTSSVTNSGYGSGIGRFLCWGCFPDGTDTTSDATFEWPGGVISVVGTSDDDFYVMNRGEMASKFLAASGTGSVPGNLFESIKNSRYAKYVGDTAEYTEDSGYGAYPGAISRTQPDRSNGYSYIKSPRWNGRNCEVGPFADMVVGGLYPAGGGTLSGHKLYGSGDSGTGLAGQMAKYLKSNDYEEGLDPNMIDPDIAVALLRESLAELDASGTAVTYEAVAASGSLTAAEIGAAYFAPTTVITGIINTWIRNMTGGLSTMDRLRARALQSLVLVQAMVGDYDGADWDTEHSWIKSLSDLAGVSGEDAAFCRTLPIPTGEVQGWGGNVAARGALMHQCTINNGKITKYQCIVPTTWNGSPKDAAGNRGAIEEAVVGTPYATDGATFTKQDGTKGTTQGGVEALRVTQSFDPCIACAIH